MTAYPFTLFCFLSSSGGQFGLPIEVYQVKAAGKRENVEFSGMEGFGSR